MIFNNVLFHNVSFLTECEGGGYRMHRFPLSVEEKLSEGGKIANRVSTGVELRFKPLSERVTLRLSLKSKSFGSATAYVYRGGILGGWKECSFNYYSDRITEVHINKLSDLSPYERITEAAGYKFSPEVVRIVFNSAEPVFHGIEGEVAPPEPSELPQKTYLAYGSSITHGSLSTSIPESFAFRVASRLGYDLLNRGLAGNARLEPAVADEIAEMGRRGEWNIATLCMGINILSTEPAEFDHLVRNMIKTVASANPDKQIFCISPLYCSDDLFGRGRAERFRDIIKNAVLDNAAFRNLHYINGLELLEGPQGLSGDLTHPSPDGVSVITEKLIKAISPFI